MTDAGIRVSLFIDPDQVQIAVAHALGAPVVELHTGAYCEAVEGHRSEALVRLRQAAKQAAALGLEVHAGHGLTFDTVGPVAAIGEMAELNIGALVVVEGGGHMLPVTRPDLLAERIATFAARTGVRRR